MRQMQFIDPFASNPLRDEHADEGAKFMPAAMEKPAAASPAPRRQDREHEVRRLINDLAELVSRSKPPVS